MKRPEVEHNLLRLLKIDIIGCFIVASLLIAVVTLDLLGVGIGHIQKLSFTNIFLLAISSVILICSGCYGTYLKKRILEKFRSEPGKLL